MGLTLAPCHRYALAPFTFATWGLAVWSVLMSLTLMALAFRISA